MREKLCGEYTPPHQNHSIFIMRPCFFALHAVSIAYFCGFAREKFSKEKRHTKENKIAKVGAFWCVFYTFTLKSAPLWGATPASP